MQIAQGQAEWDPMPKYLPATAKAKAKKFTKDYLSAGLNQSKMARRRGVNKAAINKALKQPAVQTAIAEVFEQAGITDKKLAQRVNEGLDATETKFFQHNGRVKQTREVVDYDKRHKYVQTALEVKKHIKADEDTKPITIKIDYGWRKPKEPSP